MNQQIKTWLGVAIIIIMAVTAGVFVWLAQKNQGEIAQPPAQQPVKVTPVSNNETSDWQTYRNEKYGFELKVPKNWKAENERKLKYSDEGGNVDVSDKISQISIGFSPNDNKDDYLYLASMSILITPTRNLEICRDTPLCSMGEKIAEKDGYTFGYTYALEGGSNYVVLDNSSDKYKEYDKKKTEIINAVIKTFKFTN